jgi:hypothetical protein
MVNTYAWIILTAISNDDNKICVILIGRRFSKFEVDACLPNKVISRCPAIILAANRTAKVPGRIILLIISISTMKGINIIGVLFGTKCAIINLK